jgi:hypothetical protein
MNRDDENWFDALAGKPSTDAATSTSQEAYALRAVILAAQKNTSQTQDKVVDINSLQLLKQRLRSEGLLPPAQSKSNNKRTVVTSLAATLIVCAGLTLSLQGLDTATNSDALTINRGGEDSVSVSVADAKTAVHQLQVKLSALNIKSQVQCEPDNCTIEAFIPSAHEDIVNTFLKPNEKTVGANGQLLLKFRRQEKQ